MPTSSLRRAVEAVDAQTRRADRAAPRPARAPRAGLAGAAHHGLVAEHLEKVGVEVQLLPEERADRRARVRRGDGPLDRAARRPRRAPGRRPRRQPWASTVDGVAHACGHDVHTAVAGRGGHRAARGAPSASPLPGRVRLLFQPAEEVMPGGALEVIAAGALDGVSHVFGLHCDPSIDVGAGRPARRPADRRRRRADRAADRPRRPHLPPAPDRGPHLRARQAGHRAPRRAVAPARPARRRQPGLGRGPRRLGEERHPRVRRGRRHPADARRGRLGGRRGPRPRADRPDPRAVRRAGGDHLRARRAAGRQQGRVRPRCSARGVSDVLGKERGRLHRRRASAARTSRGTSSRSRAPWAASARARPAARPTTCTRATCRSTSGPSAIGAKVLAAAVLTTFDAGSRRLSRPAVLPNR